MTTSKTDWERLNRMTDEEIDANAQADPDAHPTTKAIWHGARVVMPQVTPIALSINPVLLPLTTLRQALALAQVRNSCAAFMTNNAQLISPLQQARWFTRRYWPAIQQAMALGELPAYRVWLIVAGDEADTGNTPPILGYLGMAMSDDGYLITEGLAPAARGKGLGTWLLHHALNEQNWFDDKPIWADIFDHNAASVKLHQGFGFTPVMALGNEVTRYRWQKGATNPVAQNPVIQNIPQSEPSAPC
jgi:GNAT superfamily N-acetyltransferase